MRPEFRIRPSHVIQRLKSITRLLRLQIHDHYITGVLVPIVTRLYLHHFLE